MSFGLKGQCTQTTGTEMERAGDRVRDMGETLRPCWPWKKDNDNEMTLGSVKNRGMT